MSKVSLAKLLKVKNRLAGRLSKTQDQITQYNCVIKEQSGKVNVEGLLTLRDKLSEALISVKTAIQIATTPIQRKIYTLAERKGTAEFFSNLNTSDGIRRHGYQNTDVEYVATVKQEQSDSLVKKLESEIDTLQDEIDEFNAVTKVEIEEGVLILAS